MKLSLHNYIRRICVHVRAALFVEKVFIIKIQKAYNYHTKFYGCLDFFILKCSKPSIFYFGGKPQEALKAFLFVDNSTSHYRFGKMVGTCWYMCCQIHVISEPN